MSTEIEHVDRTIDDLRKHSVTFVHSPSMWASCALPCDLVWESLAFGEGNREQVPSTQFGVYAFMLEPNLGGPPKAAYLLYIGMTKRTFQERYGEYLDRELKRFGRTVIGRMLERWDGHITFHYAAVADKALVTQIEESLLNACIPPYNQRFTGKVGSAIMAFKAEP